MTGEDNPLTARVTVNRFWQQLFGIGLIKSPENFGVQSEVPIHPRLLDWLAVEFQENGWDVKRLLRNIVLSATYRQSSHITAESHSRDPENRLLARGPRMRMDAEVIRDSALFSSGLLRRQVGGPSVYPYHPAGLWLELNNRPGYSRTYPHPRDSANLYRPSLYTYWKRSVPPPNMFALDAPTREMCITRRQRTNTPLMALVLMNDPTFVEAARALAVRALVRDVANQSARLQWLFARVTARRPVAEELKILVALLDDQRVRFRAHPASARELLAVGSSPIDGRVEVVEQAAWTALCSVLLNTDEAITRE